MRVFVTGASGFVGSAVVPELIAAGHDVLGLARSDAAATALTAAGAEVLPGDLADPDSLRRGAETADAVIHLAFHHDFSDYGRAATLDRDAITTLGDVVAGSDRPLVVTSGMAGLGHGVVLTEQMAAAPDSPRVSEGAAWAARDRGARAVAVRLSPSVHDQGDYGFVPQLIKVARERGVSGYPGNGSTRWPAVHRRDAARLFRLAVEQAPAGEVLHAVADTGITSREIATTIGRGLGLPVESIPAERSAEHFGWIGAFFALDLPASSDYTRARYGWTPTHIGLLDDMAAHYFG